MNSIDIRSRFKDATWFPRQGEMIDCLIGGAGGIGSWLAFFLARAGFMPVIYDFDTVELHNMGGQLFKKTNIGESKVQSIRNTIYDFCDTEIMFQKERYDGESMTSDYTFAAFDNMQARKDLFENWYRDNKDNPNAILIDGRLLMEQMQIFCVTPDTATHYKEHHLFDDAEVQAENCTLKQTSHSAAMIATLMTGFFTNHLSNVNAGVKMREVPFFHEYFIPMNLTTESDGILSS